VPILRAIAIAKRIYASVVPAKAGIHHHRRLLEAKAFGHRAKPQGRGVWVPAFAGTTLEIMSGLTRRANQQKPVQPCFQKYSDFQKTQITFITLPSCPTEGRLEIVTDAGQDAVDADVPLTNGA
jgi:hypothetical protein